MADGFSLGLIMEDLYIKVSVFGIQGQGGRLINFKLNELFCFFVT